MTLTQRQKDVLNHIVEDGQAWADHGESHFGVARFTPMLLSKVEKYEQSYLDAQGPDYQTRKQRDDASVIAEQEQYDNVTWDIKRQREYNLLNQFELIGEDSINGTTNHIDAIKAIKAKYPKE